MATTARTSAALSRTAEAVAAPSGTRARRTAESTRSGSPSLSGRRWFPASDTWMAASAWPKRSPGSARHQRAARRENASA